FGWLFRPIREQRFFNVRTYVRCGAEPGALFLWGWLGWPFRLPLPSGIFGLPYGFAAASYNHDYETGALHGQVNAAGTASRFSYRGVLAQQNSLQPCVSGSLAE